MLATKAFGMGIDIPDISNVYHFAPTGNVCDYVQEVGRAARALDSGCAYLDYLSKDFTHVNRLHGISTLRKNQLIQVIDKVLKLYYQQGEKRNLLVSSEEFKYIFTSSNMEDADVDNKFKTALLILENDFQMKFQYSPLIGRPRSLFTVDYFIIPDNLVSKIIRQIGSYLSIHDERNNNLRSHGNIYRCDMKGLWEDKYKNLSFPQFKYLFYSNPEDLNLEELSGIIPVLWIDLQLSGSNYSMFLNKFDKMLQQIEDIFGSLGISAKHFDQDYLTDMIARSLKQNKYFCENLADVLLNSMQYFQRLKRSQSNFYKPFLRFHENYQENNNKYSIQNSGYQDFFGFFRNKVEHIFNLKGKDQTEFKVYIAKPKSDKVYLEQIFICLGLIESMGLAVYQVNGGDSPQVFIRINSKMRLERIVHAPDKYENIILKNVKDRHYISVKMLKYLFESKR